jgi:hypothetical protein
MNVNVYLPDDIGARAKEASLPFSQLLQAAVADELERRRIMSETLTDVAVYEVDIEHPDGYVFTGRITGTLIADQVFLTEDERILVYDENRSRVDEVEVGDLEDVLDERRYLEAMVALGEQPIIDL